MRLLYLRTVALVLCASPASYLTASASLSLPIPFFRDTVGLILDFTGVRGSDASSTVRTPEPGLSNALLIGGLSGKGLAAQFHYRDRLF